MSELSLAYIFHQQQLLVDEQFQLPRVEKLASDLSTGNQVIARDLLPDEPIPEGYQLLPIRQLLQFWNSAEFEQASRAIQLLEWRRNHRFAATAAIQPKRMPPNMPWFARSASIANIHVYNPVSLPSLPAVKMKFCWPKMRETPPICMA